MDINNFLWLELIDYPAFCVKDGVVIATNALAEQRQFLVGMDVNEIVTEQWDIYEAFEDGSLYLHINMCGIPCPATVIRTPECDIFHLRRTEEDDALKSLALASTQLRAPLANMLTTINQLLPDLKGKTARSQAGQINQNLYRLMRIINNMSDASGFSHATQIGMETTDLTSLMGEIMEKAQTLFSGSDISLLYSGPNAPIFSVVNPEKIERAIYNLLSNAAKFSQKGSTVNASLTATDKRLTFTLCNTNSEGVSAQNLWQQYRREPSLEDPRRGLGLGMTLVSAVAAAHGGTILADNPTPDQTRITFTLPITTEKCERLRSPIVRMSDYAGGYDKGLLELSEVLSTDAYKDIH